MGGLILHYSLTTSTATRNTNTNPASKTLLRVKQQSRIHILPYVYGLIILQLVTFSGQHTLLLKPHMELINVEISHENTVN